MVLCDVLQVKLFSGELNVLQKRVMFSVEQGFGLNLLDEVPLLYYLF